MITSLTNEKIKRIIKLKDSKYRESEKCFIVEGPHLVLEAKKMNLLLETFTIDEKIEGTLVSEAVMKKICNTVNPTKCIGICKINSNNFISNNVLILDNINDPTNLGTILRSAKAFGFDTVFSSYGTVDYYNDKVIRGSQGAIFKLSLLKGDIIDFIKKLKETHLVYATDVVNGIDIKNISSADKIAIVLGNEARGVSKEVKAITLDNLYIPMDNMESLNVSVAASILMYERKKRISKN